MKTKLLAPIVLILSLSACVSSSDFERVERQNRLLTLELANAKKTCAMLERELASAKAGAAALEAQIAPLTQLGDDKTKLAASLDAELARKEEAIASLKAQLAGLDLQVETHH